MSHAALAYMGPAIARVSRQRFRLLSVSLIPSVIAALLLSVIIPALEMRRVMRLLSEIGELVEPSREVLYRLDQVAAHERQSLFINAILVIV